jgi:multiple sugar transport system permease protein
VTVTDLGDRVAERAATRPRHFWSIPRRDALVGYLLISPQLVGSALFVLLPLGLVVYYSLQE